MNLIVNIFFKPLFILINYIKATEWVALGLVFLINIIIKLTIIDVTDISLTEAIEIDGLKKSLFSLQKNEIGWTVFEPLYRLILFFWSKLVGNSIYGIRSLSALFFSIAAVFLFKGINKYVNFRVACWVSLFFLLNNIFTYSSQDISVGGLVVLISILSSFNYLELINDPSIKNTIKLAVINCFLFYTSNSFISLVFVQILISVFFFKRDLKFILIAFAIQLIACNYWLINYFLKNKIVTSQLDVEFNFDYLKDFLFLNFVDYFFFNVFFAITLVVVLNVYVKKLYAEITFKNGKTYFYYFICFALFYVFIFKSSTTNSNPFENKPSLFLALSLTIILGFIYGYNHFSPKINLVTFAFVLLSFAPAIKLGQNKKWPSKAMINMINQHQNSKTAFLYDNYLPFTFYLDPMIFEKPTSFLDNYRLKNIYSINKNLKIENLKLQQFDTVYFIHQNKWDDTLLINLLKRKKLSEVNRLNYYGNYKIIIFNRK